MEFREEAFYFNLHHPYYRQLASLVYTYCHHRNSTNLKWNLANVILNAMNAFKKKKDVLIYYLVGKAWLVYRVQVGRYQVVPLKINSFCLTINSQIIIRYMYMYSKTYAIVSWWRRRIVHGCWSIWLPLWSSAASHSHSRRHTWCSYLTYSLNNVEFSKLKVFILPGGGPRIPGL